MHPSDIFNSNDFPPPASARPPASEFRLSPLPPPARPSRASVERWAAECAAGTDNYDRVAEWFSKWLHSLGVAVRFVRRQPNEYVGTNHYTGFCTRISDNVRSAFFIYEDVGTEFVNRMRSTKCR